MLIPGPGGDIAARVYTPQGGGDGSRLAVSGLSAGATMAVVSALRARDEDGPALRGQALFYPVTDYPTLLTASYQTYANGYGLTQDNMLWFWEQYLQTPAAGAHPYASPLRAESLAGLPPACVFVAECDVLHDEGAAYAQRMQLAGVATHFEVCKGTAHSFLKYAGVLPEVDAVLAKTYGWLRGVLAGSVSPPRA